MTENTFVYSVSICHYQKIEGGQRVKMKSYWEVRKAIYIKWYYYTNLPNSNFLRCTTISFINQAYDEGKHNQGRQVAENKNQKLRGQVPDEILVYNYEQFWSTV